jgi:hypothetical protein
MPIIATSAAATATLAASSASAGMAGSSTQSAIVPALIAGVVSLLVAGLSNFGSESYRRHRGATSVAGALAGELSAHAAAMPELRGRLRMWLELSQGGQRLEMQHLAPPNDPIFDSCVGALGALGPSIAEDVAFVYSNIRGFRQVMSHIAGEATTAEQQRGAIVAALEGIDRTEPRVILLIGALRRVAASEWLAIG